MKNGESLPWAIRENKPCDRMIKQLLNEVIAEHRDMSVSRRSIICLILRLRQELICSSLTNHDISFAQPRRIIVNSRAFKPAACFSFKFWIACFQSDYLLCWETALLRRIPLKVRTISAKIIYLKSTHSTVTFWMLFKISHCNSFL